MSALIEAACTATFSASSDKNQTLLFIGNTDRDVGENFQVACRFLASKFEEPIEIYALLVQIFNKRVKDSNCIDIPYNITIKKSPSSKSGHIASFVRHFATYSDESMITAALLFGAPVHVRENLRLPEVDIKLAKKVHNHQFSTCKAFYKQLQDLFEEDRFAKFSCIDFLQSSIAAILHLKSGNGSSADSILGTKVVFQTFVKNGIATEIIIDALYNIAVEWIFACLERGFDKTTDEQDYVAKMIGLTDTYSNEGTWKDFYKNYFTDFLQLASNDDLLHNMEIHQEGSVIKDFVGNSTDVVELAKIREQSFGVHHLSRVIHYNGNFKCNFMLVEEVSNKIFSALATAEKWQEAFCIGEKFLEKNCLLSEKEFFEVLNFDLQVARESTTRTLHCRDIHDKKHRSNVYCSNPANCKFCNDALAEIIATKLHMQRVWGSEDEEDQQRHLIDTMIWDNIEKNFLDLPAVKVLVADHFGGGLSKLDELYVSQKYIDCCLEIWSKDARLLCHRIQSEEFNQYINAIDNFSKIIEAPEEFSRSRYLQLLQKNYSLITPENETHCLLELKKFLRTTLFNASEPLKKEFEFISAVKDYVRSCKNVKSAIESAFLLEFVDGKIDFCEFQSRFLQQKEFQGEEKKDLVFLISTMDTEYRFTQISRLQKFVHLYAKPPSIKLELLNEEDCFVEIKTMVLELSTVVDKIESFINSKNSVKEIKIIAADVCYLDADLNGEIYNGLNVTIHCPRLIVYDKSVMINVSGKACQQQHAENAGTEDDGRGKDGVDGYAGESGGNITITAETIINGERLHLISNGGDGGQGQDGGDGFDGEDGKGLDLEIFRNLYKSPVRFYGTNIGIRPAKLIFERLKEHVVEGKSYIDQGLLNNYVEIYVNGTKKEARGQEIIYTFSKNRFSSNTHGSFLWKGTYGEEGKSGGYNGLGGMGGQAGNVAIANFTVNIETTPGQNGQDGTSGFNGRPGLNGWDVGYVDFRWWKNTYLKGESGKSKLQWNTHHSSASDRIYCRALDRYVSITDAGPIPSTNVSVRERQQKCQRKKRQSHAESRCNHMTTVNDLQNTYGDFMDKATQCLNDVTLDAELANLRNNQNLLQETKDDAVEEENLNVKVSREAKIITVSKTSRFAHSQSPPIFTEKKLFDKEGNFCRLNVALIKQMKFDDDSLQKLFKFVTSEINNHYLSDQEKRLLHHVAISHWRQNKLMQLSPGLKNIRFSDEVLLDENVGNFLRHHNGPSGINHDDLGTVDNYIVMDAPEHREAITAFCMASKNFTHALALFLSIPLKDVEDKDAESVYERWSKDYINFLIDKQLQIKVKVNEFEESIRDIPSILEEWKKYQKKEIDRTEFIDILIKKKGRSVWMLKYRKKFNAIYEKADEKFNWESALEDTKLATLFYDHIKLRGVNSYVYIQLLAEIFNIQIKLYECEKYACFKKCEAFNLKSSTLLIVGKEKYGSMKILKVDEEHQMLERNRYLRSQVINKVLHKVMSIENCNDETDFSEMLIKPDDDIILSCDCENFDAAIVASAVNSSKFFKILRDLSDLKNENNILLHILAIRFTYENSQIDERTLMFIINSALRAVLNKTNELSIMQWILMVEQQSFWVAEFSFLNLQNYYRKDLSDQKLHDTLKFNLKNIAHHELLILMCVHLQNELRSKQLSLEELTNTTTLLMTVKNIPQRLYETDVANWIYYLENAYWKEKLTKLLVGIPEDDIVTATYYVQVLILHHDKVLLDNLINVLEDKSTYLEPKHIALYITNFYTEEWDLSDSTVQSLRETTNAIDLKSWEEQVNLGNSTEEHRSTAELAKIITERNIAEPVKKTIEKYKEISESKKIIKCRDKDGDEIILSYTKIISLTRPFSDGMSVNLESLEAINQCILMKRGFKLRDTQKLSVMMLLNHTKGTLLQVATGEGKTLIVVAAAIIKAKSGEPVDIITSSPVLATRDAEINKDIFDFFGINVYHNCDVSMQKRIEAYTKNRVIYGDISNFQRDYLLDRFYGKNILGSRKLKNVIVDEVDSMLLDKGNNILYLSHDIPLLDKLLPVYLFIWQCVNTPARDAEQIKAALDVNIIKDKILSDLFGLIKKEDLKILSASLRDDEVTEIFDCLVKGQMLNSDGTIKSFDSDLVDELLENKFARLRQRLKFYLKNLQMREIHIDIPNCLKPFVVRHLDFWIKSALNAMCMQEKEKYILDVNRTEGSNEINPNIIIVDTDTGTDQVNSQWDEALHQFLQLKHGCTLSSQSLKAVFISNVSYFRTYENIYGLTGTLGSRRELDLLQDLHNVDFVTIPTSKPKKFHELSPICCDDRHTWINTIRKEVIKTIVDAERSVLMICETVEDVEMFESHFHKYSVKPITYTRDYEDFRFSDSRRLETGKLIISTNLAGRGTDVKLSEKLIMNGGLHVVLTFLPKNSRIEQQAYGRAARCGEPGSGIQIFATSDSLIQNVIMHKKIRDDDEGERITYLKTYYERCILVQEKCFELFRKFYKKRSDDLDRNLGMLVLDHILIKLKGEAHNSNFLEEARLASTRAEIKEIILQSLLDEWAFWLDSKGEIVNDVEKADAKIIEMAKLFIDNLSKRTDFASMLSGNIAALLKLAKFHLKQSDPQKATEIYDRIIELEPHHSECAYYYRAYSSGVAAKWDKNIIKSKVASDMRKAKLLFEKRRNDCYNAAGMIAQLKRVDKMSKIKQIDAFERQQDNLANIYAVFLSSIDSVLGYGVMPHDFAKEGISKIQSEELYTFFQENGILSKSYFNAKPKSLEAIERSYGIEPGQLDEILKEKYSSSLSSEKELLNSLEHANYPCAENMWQILKSNSALLDEEEYVLLSLDEIKMYDATLFNKVTENLKDQTKSFVKLPLGTLNLYQSPQEENPSYMTVSMQEYLQVINIEMHAKLLNNNYVTVNKRAKLNKEALLSVNMNMYCNLKLEHLLQVGIDEEDANSILLKLIDQKYLIKEDNIYVLSDPTKDLKEINLTDFPIYNGIVIQLMQIHFCYHSAHQMLIKEESIVCLDSLPCKVNSLLFTDLVNQGWIEMPQVIYEGDLNISDEDCIIDKFISFFNWDNNMPGKLPPNMRDEKTVKHIASVLRQKRSISRSFESPVGKFENILVNFPRCSSDFLMLINGFSLQSLDDVIVFAEKGWTWKMLMVRVPGVLGIGVVQLAIGLLISLFTVGSMAWVGSGFVSEGINDFMYATAALWSGQFSWSAYAKQKMFSVAMTAASFGLAAYLSRGSKLSSFGVKLFKDPNLVGKALIKKAGGDVILKEFSKQVAMQGIRTIAITSINAGVDKLMESQMRDYCSKLSEDLLAIVIAAVESPAVDDVLQKAYETMGPQKATQFISNLTNDHFAEKNVENKYLSFFTSIFDSLSRGVFEAKLKIGKEQSALNSAVTALQLISLAISIGRAGYKIGDMLILSNSFLCEMEVKIRREVAKTKEEKHTQKRKDDKSAAVFKNEIKDMWKKSLNDTVGRQISQKIIGPVLKKVGTLAVYAVGRSIKKFYKNYLKGETEEQNLLKTQYLKKKQAEENTKEEENSESIDRVLNEQNEKLREQIKESRNIADIAELVKNGAPFDITAVKAGVAFAENEIKSPLDVEVHDLTNGKIYDIPSKLETDAGGTGARKIKIFLKNGHFFSEDGTPISDPTLGPNDCFYTALASQCKDLQTDAKTFREGVSSWMKKDAELSEFVRLGQHESFINDGFYGGRERTRSICQTCPHMATSRRLEFPSGDFINVEREFTCETSCVIYAYKLTETLEDGSVREYYYVGKTEKQFHIRDEAHLKGQKSAPGEFIKNSTNKIKCEAYILEKVDLSNAIPGTEKSYILYKEQCAQNRIKEQAIKNPYSVFVLNKINAMSQEKFNSFKTLEKREE